MSLLDSMPHECTIQRLSREKKSLGGSKTSVVVEQTGVECWRQPLSSKEVEYNKQRGIESTHKVYFNEDPQVGKRHQIKITAENGTTLATPETYEVVGAANPDASSGLGVVWKVYTLEDRKTRGTT